MIKKLNRDTVNVLIVTGILAVICFALGVCSAKAAACTPLRLCEGGVTTACETPTPVITWDQVTDSRLWGYLLYVDQGGVPQKVRDIACVWEDRSDPPDGVKETRTCLGPDVWLALQREGAFTPLTLYTFRLKARWTTGEESSVFSNPLDICFRPICVPPGPCN